MRWTKSKEKEDFQEKLKRFEKFKNLEKAFIVFEDYNSSDYILYRDELETILVVVEEQTTLIDDIKDIFKREEKPVVIYIKKK